MTKTDFALLLHDRLGLSKVEAAEVLDDMLETVKQTLATGEDVKVSGFGKWQIQRKKARRGRNPQSGEAIRLSPRCIVAFKPSRKLREQLN